MSGLSEPAQKQLDRFQRQYLQLQQDIQFPDAEHLKGEAFQAALYDAVFKQGRSENPPPARYQLRVLKELLSRIESSITDWEEESVSDDLMNLLATFLSSTIPSEAASAQQKSYVTYTFASPSPPAPTLTLLESPTLLASAGNTGLRTWEAALHLCAYLVTPAGRALIRGNSILELGAGTGIVSILCARYLDAQHVWATDGSADVLDPLATNFYLNHLQHSRKIEAMQYWWGHAFMPSGEDSRDGLASAEDESKEKREDERIDVVLGADVTYDAAAIPALIGTLREFVDLQPMVKILIAATVRNKDTFQTFLDGCEKARLSVEMVDFPVTPKAEQMGPFYSDTTPIAICSVTSKDS